MLLAPSIKAVCFDAFGTLVDITDKRRPFRQMLDNLEGEAQQSLQHRIMREPLSLEDCLKEFGHKLPESLTDRLRADLAAELASIKIRPQTNALWSVLRSQGYKIGLCSNLALDYGPPLLKTLPGIPDAQILSYDTNCIKPEPQIYRLVCDILGLVPEKIFFSGDTQLADVDGPKAFGMDAELIDPFTIRVLGAKARP